MKDEFVDIIKKEERRNSMMSYFWDNKIEKIYRIKFSKKDNKEEFMDYISKLMADNYWWLYISKTISINKYSLCNDQIRKMAKPY